MAVPTSSVKKDQKPLANTEPFSNRPFAVNPFLFLLPAGVMVLSAVGFAAATSGSKRSAARSTTGSTIEAVPTATAAVSCTFAPWGNS